MKIIRLLLVLLPALLLPAMYLESLACSMCKVTINGRTWLGNNEDSWRLGSKVWFEKAEPGKLGAVYVGYSDYFPQGGMNEAGLAFDGLTIYPKNIKPDPSKKSIVSAPAFIKELMQTCRTVEDVKQYANQYNREKLNAGVLLFADSTGKYLVLEPDTVIIGSDDKYIIANFCPSNTTDEEKLNWDRYARGKSFISNHPTDTSEQYALALTDTMHECRNRLGDGTMYSFVADLQKQILTLYFYHDFTHKVIFNLISFEFIIFFSKHLFVIIK